MARYPPQLGTRPWNLKTLLTNTQSLAVTLKWSFKLLNSTLSQFCQTLVITVPGDILADSYLTRVNTQRETEIMSGCPNHQRMDPSHLMNLSFKELTLVCISKWALSLLFSTLSQFFIFLDMQANVFTSFGRLIFFSCGHHKKNLEHGWIASSLKNVPIPFDEFIITQTGFGGHFQMPLQPCDLTLSQFLYPRSQR